MRSRSVRRGANRVYVFEKEEPFECNDEAGALAGNVSRLIIFNDEVAW